MLPLAQVVPAATSCQTSLPLLQIPNWVAPLHTIAPSSEQVDEPPPGVEGVPEPPPGVEGVVGVAGDPVPAGGVGRTGGVGVAVTVTRVVEVEGRTGAVGPAGEPLEAPGAKTPPPLGGRGAAEGLLPDGGDGAPPAGGVGATVGWPPTAELGATEGWPAAGGEGAEGAPPAGDVEAGEGSPPAGEDGSAGVEPVAPQLPVGSFKSLVLPFCTVSPGLGNLVAKFWGEVHPSLMLATNMSGSSLKAESSLAPPVTSIGAQFM